MGKKKAVNETIESTDNDTVDKPEDLENIIGEHWYRVIISLIHLGCNPVLVPNAKHRKVFEDMRDSLPK